MIKRSWRRGADPCGRTSDPTVLGGTWQGPHPLDTRPKPRRTRDTRAAVSPMPLALCPNCKLRPTHERNRLHERERNPPRSTLSLPSRLIDHPIVSLDTVPARPIRKLSSRSLACLNKCSNQGAKSSPDAPIILGWIHKISG